MLELIQTSVERNKMHFSSLYLPHLVTTKHLLGKGLKKYGLDTQDEIKEMKWEHAKSIKKHKETEEIFS
jgi:hypothetical protein